MTLTELSRGVYIHPISNNTPSSPPSGTGGKIKSLNKEKYDGELPAGIRNGSSFSTLVIDRDLQMGGVGGVSGVNGSMTSHTLSQNYWDFNNGDMSSENGFINKQTLSQCNNSINFKEMDGYVDNCCGHVYMNI